MSTGKTGEAQGRSTRMNQTLILLTALLLAPLAALHAAEPTVEKRS